MIICQTDPYAFHLKILDCRTELRDPFFPYGAITSGYLEVFGRRRQIKWHESFHHAEDHDKIPGLFYNINKSKIFKQFTEGRVQLDCIEDNLWDPAGSYPPVSLLEFLDDLDTNTICGLVLRQIENSKCFRRIGLFFFRARYRKSKYEPGIELQEEWEKTDPEKYRKIRAHIETYNDKRCASIRSQMTLFDSCKREIITIR
jgi:hypothetical protein